MTLINLQFFLRKDGYYFYLAVDGEEYASGGTYGTLADAWVAAEAYVQGLGD